MSLKVQNIFFRNFRNYSELSLNDLGALTIFVGQNAIGKTNIIEGIQLLTALTSFRNPLLQQLIQQGKEESYIATEVSDGSRELTIGLHIKEHSKKYVVNGKGKQTQDLKGLIPSVSFTPDDLYLIKGSMSERRNALDVLGSQLSSNYYVIKKDYEKIIKHKNKLLKEEASDLLLDSIDETLTICGAQLSCYRSSLLSKLAPLCADSYKQIIPGGEELSVTYIPSWEVKNSKKFSHLSSDITNDEVLQKDAARELLQTALHGARSEERARKRSVIGPHADHINFALNNLDATTFASQGQQRSIVLAYKLAEVQMVEDHLHQKPILLLDDVMSELDEQRRTSLVSFLMEDTQTFITTTNLQYFNDGLLQRAQIIQLPLEI